jgi:cytochrome P450
LKKFQCSEEDLQKQKDILSLTLSSVLRSKNKTPQQSDCVSISSDDMENMTSQLKTFYFAGHDTTATTICWAYWLLVQHPDSLQRARDEVEASLGKEWMNAAMEGEALTSTTFEKLQECLYLEAVARETLRLYPPAASTRYSNDPNATTDGLNLGKGIVHLNFYAIQRDPEIWDDPDKFIPERFLGEEGRKRVVSSGYLPFSKGARDCIGKYFALLEAKIALAALICRYDGGVVDEKEVYTTRLTSIPKGGCAVNLSLRKN